MYLSLKYFLNEAFLVKFKDYRSTSYKIKTVESLALNKRKTVEVRLSIVRNMIS